MKLGVMFCATMLAAQAPAGWQTIEDPTKACHLSVPPNWKVDSSTGQATAPEETKTTVLSGNHRFKRLDDDTIRMLGIGRMFENSAHRIFYVSRVQPDGDKTRLTYHVEVPGKKNVCVGQIVVEENHPQDEIRKIAESLARVP